MLRLYIYGGLIVALLAGAGAIYVKGRADASNKAYITALEHTLNSITNWREANANAQSLDDYNACLKLGGLPNTCRREMPNTETTKSE